MADDGARLVRALAACPAAADPDACLAAHGVRRAPCAAAPHECRVRGHTQRYYTRHGCAVEYAPVHGKWARP
jgi:hypothetical protein